MRHERTLALCRKLDVRPPSLSNSQRADWVAKRNARSSDLGVWFGRQAPSQRLLALLAHITNSQSSSAPGTRLDMQSRMTVDSRSNMFRRCF